MKIHDYKHSYRLDEIYGKSDRNAVISSSLEKCIVGGILYNFPLKNPFDNDFDIADRVFFDILSITHFYHNQEIEHIHCVMMLDAGWIEAEGHWHHPLFYQYRRIDRNYIIHISLSLLKQLYKDSIHEF